MTHDEMRALWRMLTQTWGARFAEQYGAEPNEAWSSFLAVVTVHAARHALRALVIQGSPHPPTLPEFVAAARGYRPPGANVAAILTHRKPEMTAAQIEQRRSEMYGALGRKIP